MIKEKGRRELCKLYDNVTMLGKNRAFKMARLVHPEAQPYPPYNGNYGLVFEQVDGVSLGSMQVKKKHMDQILKMYGIFQKTTVKGNPYIMNAVDLDAIKKNCLDKCDELSAKSKKRFGVFVLYRFLLYLLKNRIAQMQKADLVRSPEKIKLLHGDFHLGNILFHKGKLQAFLDFEELRGGYPTEDLMRLVLSAVNKTPSFGGRYKILNKFIPYLVDKNKYDLQEWMLGLNTFFLFRIRKILIRRSSISRRKLLRLIFSFQFYTYAVSKLDKAFRR
ncbi:MAG: phosphotransferase [Lactobacillales bacterium]|nr:phosphotransferase [Lactobacillales bacterium]